jgi:hypothetical protein
VQRRVQRVDAQRDLMRFTVDVTSGLPRPRPNTLEAEGDVIQRHLDKVIPAIARRMFAPVPYWRWLRLPADRKLDAAMIEVRKLVNDLVAEAARVATEPANTPSRQFFSTLWSRRKAMMPHASPTPRSSATR